VRHWLKRKGERAVIRNIIKRIKNPGALEYILLLVVVVMLALIFRDKLKDLIQEKGSGRLIAPAEEVGQE